MKIIEVKNIEGIDQTFCKVKKVICDKCSQEITKGDIYVDITYATTAYNDYGFKHKHYCKDCAMQPMYQLFMENGYTSFNKEKVKDNEDWFRCDEYDFEDFNYVAVGSDEQ